MSKEERQKLLAELSRTNMGRALQDLIEEELSKIDTVKGVKSLEEALGRELATESLERIFSFLDKPNPQAPRNKLIHT